MFVFGSHRRSRRPNLLPMIDIIFLLLIFFMLATRFGTAAMFEVTTSRTSDDYQGPPRLVEVGQNSFAPERV